MTSISELRRTADERGQQLSHQYREVRNNLQPLQVIDELIGTADPEFSALARIEAKARENPFALLVTVAGIWLLVRQAMSHDQAGMPELQKRLGRSRPLRVIHEGEENGDYSSDFRSQEGP